MSGHCRITPDGSPSGLVSEPAGELAPVIGRIETLVGSCTVSRSGASPAQLNIGDLVGPSDVVETSAGGRLSIRFADGTAFTLSDNARMALNDYVGDKTSALFDISRGTFSFIAGKWPRPAVSAFTRLLPAFGARRNGGGIGMLSLVSLFFVAFEEAHASRLRSRVPGRRQHHVQGPRAIRHHRVDGARDGNDAGADTDLSMTLAKRSSSALLDLPSAWTASRIPLRKWCNTRPRSRKRFTPSRSGCSKGRAQRATAAVVRARCSHRKFSRLRKT